MALTPRMPLSGVRTSWLMLATNRDFIWLATSAASFAASMARSASRRAVMSCMTPTHPVSSPAGPRRALRESAAGNVVPDR